MRVFFMLGPSAYGCRFARKPKLFLCQTLSCSSCDGLCTYTRFRGQTRVPPVTNFVLLARLAVVLLPAGRLPPHGGRPRGRPAREWLRTWGRQRPVVPRAKKGGRVTKALKRRFSYQVGQGF